MALDAAVKELAPRLSSMTWTVETCRKPILFTSDRPVMCWRQRTHRDQFEGVGIDNADEIRFPLSPQNLLVIARRAVGETPVRVEPKRFVHVNADIAAQCFEFVATRRNRVNDLATLQMASRLPVLRFNVAPGVHVTPGGHEEPMGDVLHTWVPVREV
jgi:hypothetical protein